MQSVPLEHAHLPIALGSPLEPAQLDVPVEGGHQRQLACNQHAIIPLEPAQLDVPVDGQRNQSAVLSTT